MRTRRRAAVSSFESGWSQESTSTAKAEVTAEKIPACDPSQYGYIRATCKTHEYGCHIQIFIVSLRELFAVCLSYLTIVFVKSSMVHFLSGGKFCSGLFDIAGVLGHDLEGEMVRVSVRVDEGRKRGLEGIVRAIVMI